MKILYLCMGSLFKTFYDLNKNLNESMKVDAYYFVTDPSFSEKFIKSEKISPNSIIKEYDFYINNIDANNENIDILNSLDNYYTLSYSIFADRRLSNGKYAKYTFAPHSKLSTNDHRKILLNAVIPLNNFFKREKPDLIVTHGVSTFGIHLIYALSLKYKIKFLNLRHTKIKNYMTFDEGIGENYKSILAEMKKDHTNEELIEAKNYIQDTYLKKVYYSGHRYFNTKPKTLLIKSPLIFLKSLFFESRKILNLNKASYFEPNYNYIYVWFLDYIKRPLKIVYQNSLGNGIQSIIENNKKYNYLFLPLHAEPEISLSVYAKFYCNQINFIRNISLALPQGFHLLVKDHPRNQGRRPSSYLKKISQIPRATLINYEVNSLEIIDNSYGIIMLSGFVGFEALLRKKPVFCFGSSMLSRFSNFLNIYNCTNFEQLSENLRKQNKTFDENKLCKFVSSIIRRSEQIEIMTVLLKKSNRHGNKFTPQLYKENIFYLKKLLLKFI